MAPGKAPGLTWDEPAYVVAGLNYVSPSIPDPWQLNHEHPPLAKLLYGLALNLDGGAHGYLAPARFVSAFLFAGLVLLTCRAGTRLFGVTTGLAAGGRLILMPQILAHAHLAALDLNMAVAWLAAARYGLNPRKGWGGAIILGLLWGLALLTKVNGIFLIVPLLAWGRISGSLRWREMPVVIGVGLIVFVGGWPWLWDHTAQRLHEYLLDKSVRWVVPTFYLGETWDKAYPPWHYPLVMAAVTMPPAVLVWALGGFGTLLRRRPDAAKWLGLNLAFTLGLACLPGVPRYDGVRLFLAAFPFVAIAAGLGLDLMLRALAERTRLGKAGALLAVAALLAGGGGAEGGGAPGIRDDVLGGRDHAGAAGGDSGKCHGLLRPPGRGLRGLPGPALGPAGTGRRPRHPWQEGDAGEGVKAPLRGGAGLDGDLPGGRPPGPDLSGALI